MAYNGVTTTSTIVALVATGFNGIRGSYIVGNVVDGPWPRTTQDYSREHAKGKRKQQKDY
eukprot:5416276-Karenia_brevis.AAC.1